MRACPLCGSSGIEHQETAHTVATASCSNARCFLHRHRQDEANHHVTLEEWEGPKLGKIQPASAKIEAFYKESLLAVAKIARERYGDEPKVLHMIAVFGKACGMFVCACFPNERELARGTAIVNMDDAIRRYGEGEPSPMSQQ